MAVKEYVLRVIAVDDQLFRYFGPGRMEPLSHGQVTAVRKLLDMDGGPLIEVVPERSRVLAPRAANPDHHSKRYLTLPPSSGMLATLKLMATYSEPLSAAEVAELASIPKGTSSSRISQLHARGYLRRVNPDEKRASYLVTPEGHQLLVDREK